MRKPTIRAQLEAAIGRECIMRNEIERLNNELAMANFKISCIRVTERRFDQLLEGMCMGMKEASLPRRPSNG